MITVSKEQLRQVEYLIAQSIQGNHVLFDPKTLKSVIEKYDHPPSEEELYEVEHHIERLLGLPSLAQKRTYLEQLNEKTHAFVVQTYLNIVENNLFEKTPVRH